MLTHFVVGNGLAKKKSRKKFVEELKKFVEELKIFVLKQFSHKFTRFKFHTMLDRTVSGWMV